jgi:hypothetical protein
MLSIGDPSPHALHGISHDDKQAGPFIFAELPQGLHNPGVNPDAIWLMEPHNEYAMVGRIAAVGETPVGSNYHSRFP